MKLTDLKLGDKIIVSWYDELPCVIVEVDDNDDYQPVRVEWEDGTGTWPENIYPFQLVE